MALAMKETKRRREAQIAFNEEHHIEPKTIIKSVRNLLPDELTEEGEEHYAGMRAASPVAESRESIRRNGAEDVGSGGEADFETAAQLRDDIQKLKGGNAIGTGNKNYRGKTAQFKKRKRKYPKK